MVHKNIPYDMTNFFINKFKSKFFIDLIDLENKKKSIFDIRKENHISYIQSRMILKSLRYYKLLSDYSYSTDESSYKVKYSKLGLELRKKIMEIEELLKKIGV